MVLGRFGKVLREGSAQVLGRGRFQIKLQEGCGRLWVRSQKKNCPATFTCNITSLSVGDIT